MESSNLAGPGESTVEYDGEERRGGGGVGGL
jgi:hypothetical protein